MTWDNDEISVTMPHLHQIHVAGYKFLVRDTSIPDEQLVSRYTNGYKWIQLVSGLQLHVSGVNAAKGEQH